MVSSKTSSPRRTSSSTRRPSTKDSAASVAEAMSSRSSEPLRTNLSCLTPKPTISRPLKKLWRARPTAKWNMLAPRMIVLSTSKKAAAVGSELGLVGGARAARRGGRNTGHSVPRQHVARLVRARLVPVGRSVVDRVGRIHRLRVPSGGRVCQTRPDGEPRHDDGGGVVSANIAGFPARLRRCGIPMRRASWRATAATRGPRSIATCRASTLPGCSAAACIPATASPCCWATPTSSSWPTTRRPGPGSSPCRSTPRTPAPRWPSSWPTPAPGAGRPAVHAGTVGEESAAALPGCELVNVGPLRSGREIGRSGEGAVLPDDTSPDALALLLFTAGHERPAQGGDAHPRCPAGQHRDAAVAVRPARGRRPRRRPDGPADVPRLRPQHGAGTGDGGRGDVCHLVDRFDPVESLRVIASAGRHHGRGCPGRCTRHGARRPACARRCRPCACCPAEAPRFPPASTPSSPRSRAWRSSRATA